MLIRKILAATSDTNIHPIGLAKGFQATLIAIYVIDSKYRHLENCSVTKAWKIRRNFDVSKTGRLSALG